MNINEKNILLALHNLNQTENFVVVGVVDILDMYPKADDFGGAVQTLEAEGYINVKYIDDENICYRVDKSTLVLIEQQQKKVSAAPSKNKNQKKVLQKLERCATLKIDEKKASKLSNILIMGAYFALSIVASFLGISLFYLIFMV